MTTAIKLLEAKKAKILEDAQNAAAEIDRDLKKLQEMQELADKYGLAIVEAENLTVQAPEASDVVLRHNGLAPRQRGQDSLHRRAVLGAEETIRAAGKPVSLSDLHDTLIQKGVKLGGQRPQSTLSAYLSVSENVESIRKGWWWLKETPAPEDWWLNETPGRSEKVKQNAA